MSRTRHPPATPARTERLPRPARAALAFAAALALGACSPAPRHHPGTAETPYGIATFDVQSDGDTLHLLAGYGRKGDHILALWHRRSGDGGQSWSEPAYVNTADPHVIAPHPGENPQVAAAGGRVFAAWTGAGASHAGGPIATALSDDGGKTWRPGPDPADDRKPVAHHLIDIAAAGGVLHMVWLDARNGPKGLRYARSADGGASWGANRTVAAQTCDCCWNKLSPARDGAIRVLYRGDTPRDMMLAASADGAAWRSVGLVGAFDWKIRACPHVGGALVESPGGVLHALAWTGRDGALGLYHLASRDGGSNWSTPRRLGTEDARNADLAIAPDGTLAAVWDESSAAGAVVLRARSRDGGTTWSAPERISAAGVAATQPRIVATRSGFTALWLETPPGGAPVLKANGSIVAVPGG